MSERTYRDLTEIEQRLITSVITKHLDVAAVKEELSALGIDWGRIPGPERIITGVSYE